MKKKTRVFWGTLAVLAAFMMVGCATVKTAPHSFIAEGADGAATITLRTLNYENNNWQSSVTFVSHEGVKPEKELWNPVTFPSGTPARFTVKARYNQVAGGTYTGGGGLVGGIAALVVIGAIEAKKVNTDVLFKCPALEAGKSYDLWFVKSTGADAERALGNIRKGANILMLTEHDERITDGLVLLTVLEKGELNIVYQQEF